MTADKRAHAASAIRPHLLQGTKLICDSLSALYASHVSFSCGLRPCFSKCSLRSSWLRLQSAARFQEPLKTLGRLGARLSLIGFTHYSWLRLQSAARFQEPLKTLGRLGARLSLIGFTHYSCLARRGGPSFATRLLKSASCRGSTNVVR